MSQADEGMKLFKPEAEIMFDTDGASNFKLLHEAAIKEKQDQAEKLTGKQNKNARSEIGKQVQSMKADPMYIDACKVVKGLESPNGNWMTKTEVEAAKKGGYATEAPVEAQPKTLAKKEKEKKEPKKQESGGLSKAEKDELDKLKEDIIKRKAELKEQGLSGGQCNKDPQVLTWVQRMQELKIKENPLGLDGDGNKEDDKKKKEKKVSSAEKIALEKKIEDYRLSLKADFAYTDKDIKNDPDYQELLKELAKHK
eukprot:TRINITY_DN7125_c0_g2_i2.p1 TRINITY_DN7125_c0_g2~~TRINITY_DN7125_c0_g2_i2.p1  ORF type:complete len:291 (-),score=95.03 TRINITY_DN7125_c0_g2_i2:303-1064(-)